MAVNPKRKVTAVKEAYTKTQLISEISENTDLSRKDKSLENPKQNPNPSSENP